MRVTYEANFKFKFKRLHVHTPLEFSPLWVHSIFKDNDGKFLKFLQADITYIQSFILILHHVLVTSGSVNFTENSVVRDGYIRKRLRNGVLFIQ
jgi:hypothetical protein